MDFNALQHKLFALDPSDPAEDLRKLTESAGGNVQKSATSDVNYVQESVEVTQGSMPVEGDYSLSDFAALAGVTLNESQKTGNAGHLKGKDAIKKNPAGTTKNPTRNKLVGEDETPKSAFRKGFDYGADKENFNTLKAFKGGSKDAQDSSPAQQKPGAAPKAPVARVGDWRGFLKQHTAQLQQIAADPKKKAEFDKFMAKMAESVEEAPKPKTIKARDPNAQYMNDLRKSGAMGAHTNKKRDDKMGKQKHKGKEYTTESIKEMLYRKLNSKK